MSSTPRPWHFLVSAFVVWHIFAMAAYLLPEKYNGVRKIAAPYVLSLSQWQKWDIFSPNPLRRMSDYRIERQTESGWQTVRSMNFESLSWTIRAKELKVLGRLEDGWDGLIEPYLLAQCGDYPGSTVRLVVANAVLPRELEALRRVATTKLQTTEKVLGGASCEAS